MMNIRPSFNDQQGVTLAVTLIFLFVLLMVGISAVRISLVEEKMTGNLRDKHIAFEFAESALVAAELWLQSEENYPTATDDGSTNVWLLNKPGVGKWWFENTKSWWNSNAISVTANSLQHSGPQYIIEERAFLQDGEDLSIGQGSVKKGKYVYQVTGRGHGGGPDTRVHLRTTYIKRFD